MTAIGETFAGAGGPGILDRERIIAKAGFNRWLVPPAALCIHLCIGMAYGFSVFWLPLSRAIGVTAPKACAGHERSCSELFTTTCNWTRRQPGLDVHAVLRAARHRRPPSGAAGSSAPGRARPASCRRCAGAAVSLLGAIGVYTHQLWLMWLGSGVIGGIGLGLGYISPVSTLVKWFPDRRGMATGMAIMGFGGGAMIGAPLADLLMNYFKTPTDVGVWQTLRGHGRRSTSCFMMIGAFRYRIPPAGLAAGRLDAAGDRERDDHAAATCI